MTIRKIRKNSKMYFTITDKMYGYVEKFNRLPFGLRMKAKHL